MYNNETGLHEYDENLFDGAWFEDEKGFLYIVPLPNVVAECEGPDNTTWMLLTRLVRDHGRLTDEDCMRLGLMPIPSVLKRFSPEDGYYHA